MFAKKEPTTPSPVLAYRKKLEYLYARRSAVDNLIESLQDYDRFRETRTDESERRMA